MTPNDIPTSSKKKTPRKQLIHSIQFTISFETVESFQTNGDKKSLFPF